MLAPARHTELQVDLQPPVDIMVHSRCPLMEAGIYTSRDVSCFWLTHSDTCYHDKRGAAF